VIESDLSRLTLKSRPAGGPRAFERGELPMKTAGLALTHVTACTSRAGLLRVRACQHVPTMSA
jgi:hypothetical protein